VEVVLIGRLEQVVRLEVLDIEASDVGKLNQRLLMIAHIPLLVRLFPQSAFSEILLLDQIAKRVVWG